MNKSNIVTAEFIVIFISVYCFFRPDILCSFGYGLSVDGTVIARTFCLLFALYRFVKLIYFLNSGDKNGSIE
ncbi:hypothetical protein [Anaerotignum propionicum]|jgi:hypothetical protein|uniref:Uncharacterized protein n=1 Tax=Anaerotignum propionicum DSM 1682 TaxID=991789 RepID=A0A0X8V9A3_ANAPI|nr:hypothetical protein [Anaerotignum propionicum]AMJ39738.1 hypothetical protein CPRO_01140 [Anaerotignum propionicum DSM 1682]MEA5056496.1 hypothetical protein [Anaerotignum propionicum]SHE29295.1 hypothetical protein SAMN02745151_00242 [[Clostridium] propionicum DSM 1682] [Anaerotignum propionicum DSM 1682]HBF65780.1 hypothetical protein [Clostridium sp.]